MMQPAQVFSIVGAVAMLQWVLLILLPKWKITQWLIHYKVVPLLLSLVYCIYIAGFFGIKGGGFGSIQEVRVLFSHDNLLLAGWVHYLAFDILIGFYIVTSAQGSHISHWLVAPCLVLTFMLGPCGFLVYSILHKISTRNK